MRASAMSVERRYASRARVFARVRVCTSVVHTYEACTRVCREVWWLLGCLPQLSGALPARTLNPARLNLGIIRGYNQPSSLLPSYPHRYFSRCSSSSSFATFATVCLGQSSRSRVFGKRVSLFLSLFLRLAFFPFFLCPRSSFSRFSSAVASSFFLLATFPSTPFPAIFRRLASRKGEYRESPHLPRVRTFSRGRRTHLHRILFSAGPNAPSHAR